MNSIKQLQLKDFNLSVRDFPAFLGVSANQRPDALRPPGPPSRSLTDPPELFKGSYQQILADVALMEAAAAAPHSFHRDDETGSITGSKLEVVVVSLMLLLFVCYCYLLLLVFYCCYLFDVTVVVCCYCCCFFACCCLLLVLQLFVVAVVCLLLLFFVCLLLFVTVVCCYCYLLLLLQLFIAAVVCLFAAVVAAVFMKQAAL